jgi:alkylated DNA repair dioxygenase AlkB
MEYIINNESIVFVMRDWLDKEYGYELKEQLEKNVTWINHQIKGNKSIKLTRSISLLGDETVKKYPYINIPYDVDDWSKVLNQEIKQMKDNLIADDLLKQYDLSFNSCVINRYKSAREFIAWHADLEASGPQNIVACVSLGATRTFWLKEKATNKIIKVKLNHGDCLVMLGETQKHWEHSLPSEFGFESRISLTFRYIDV